MSYRRTYYAPAPSAPTHQCPYNVYYPYTIQDINASICTLYYNILCTLSQPNNAFQQCFVHKTTSYCAAIFLPIVYKSKTICIVRLKISRSTPIHGAHILYYTLHTWIPYLHSINCIVLLPGTHLMLLNHNLYNL